MKKKILVFCMTVLIALGMTTSCWCDSSILIGMNHGYKPDWSLWHIELLHTGPGDYDPSRSNPTWAEYCQLVNMPDARNCMGNLTTVALDFGNPMLIKHVPELKQMGCIPADYQLPKTFYTSFEQVPLKSRPHLETKYYERFHEYRSAWRGSYRVDDTNYVPKWKLEQGVSAATTPSATATTDDYFDAAFYAKTYPDVVAALGSDPAVLKNHYDTCGKAEGRKAHQ